MEQAYTNFNSGKYKQALNLLLASHCNTESYEPNVAVCEYLTNRCTQSNLNCLRKLNDFLNHKLHRQLELFQCQTQCNAKLNMAILLILASKRDRALPLMKEVYDSRKCFITYMQNRIFLLYLVLNINSPQELNVNLKNSIRVLQLYTKFPLKPSNRHKNNSTQWISIIVHEHNKSHQMSSEQFDFMSKVFISQAIMQLNVSAGVLPSQEQCIDLHEKLLSRVRQRKNNVHKYYQINIKMINRFLQAQKQFYARNITKALGLMNFNYMQEQLEQMPTTKIISNILNSLANSNTGLIHFYQKKFIIALSYFLKARNLLGKCCTGIEQKDLHLFSTNYATQILSINFNVALILLETNSKETYLTFTNIKKGNQGSLSYQFWYRMGQSTLQQFHSQPKCSSEVRKSLLQQALDAFTNSLLALNAYEFPRMQMRRYCPMLTQQEFEQMVIRYKVNYQSYKYSIMVLICYCSLCLGLYHRVINIAQPLLCDSKVQSEHRLQLMYYLLQAYMSINRRDPKYIQYWLNLLQQQTQLLTTVKCRILYCNANRNSIQETDYQSMLCYELSLHMLYLNKIEQASTLAEKLRMKAQLKPACSLICLLEYLHQIIGFSKKSMGPYIKVHDNM